MDIRWKRFNNNKGIKTLAFILCVVLFITSLTAMGLTYRASRVIDYSGSLEDLLRYDSYRESVEFHREFNHKLDSILYLLNQYKNEEYIKSGKTISQTMLDQAIENFYNNKNYYDVYGDWYSNPIVQEKFKLDHPKEIEVVIESLVSIELQNFKRYKQELEDIEGFSYYATDGTDSLTNVKEFSTELAVDVKLFKNMPAYLVYDSNTFTKEPLQSQESFSWTNNVDSSIKDRLNSEYNPELKVYIAFDDNFIAKEEENYLAMKEELMKWLPVVIIGALLSLALLVYLIVVTGKKNEEGNIPLYGIDKIFTEIQLAIISVAFFLGGYGFGLFLFEAVNYGISYGGGVYVNNDPLLLSILLAALIGLSSASVGLLFILSCIRNIKAGRFIKNFIIYKIIKVIYEGLKSVYHGGSLLRKIVLITLAICLVSATVVMAPFVAIVIIALAPKWVKKYEEVKKGVNEVKSGNLTYKIPLEGDGELDLLAKGINEISEASNKAIQNELRNQRLKTDLISNVSHDLKTPLTSIITYIDLLKKEGLDCEDAPKYLDILDQKSMRLQKLTEDLFDAAKASSGAIPVRFEKVEMLSLINQGLGEMSDRITASGLEFKINAGDEKYYVRADGQLIWRVVENLLGNVLKYAQEGSRVYIDLKKLEGSNGKSTKIVLEMKNISKTELNIDAEELMERFKRGDESRTTEGSGLGLAIAKDLVRLQNGWFEIKIDGDLFKAVVMLEEYSS